MGGEQSKLRANILPDTRDKGQQRAKPGAPYFLIAFFIVFFAFFTLAAFAPRLFCFRKEGALAIVAPPPAWFRQRQ